MTAFDLRLVTHNIAGGAINFGSADALGAVNSQINHFAPHIVMMQEVCQVQAEAFAEQHPDWSSTFSLKRLDHPRCGPGSIGEVLASPFPMSNIRRHWLAPTTYSREQRMVTAKIQLPERAIIAAVVHLMPEGLDLDGASRKKATQSMLSILNPLVDQGKTIALGGDFNMGPRSENLDGFYFVEGTGRFDELDQDHTGTLDRSSAGHQAQGKSKLDYLFVAGTGSGHRAVNASVIETPVSDHHLYRGTARIDR